MQLNNTREPTEKRKTISKAQAERPRERARGTPREARAFQERQGFQERPKTAFRIIGKLEQIPKRVPQASRESPAETPESPKICMESGREPEEGTKITRRAPRNTRWNTQKPNRATRWILKITKSPKTSSKANPEARKITKRAPKVPLAFYFVKRHMSQATVEHKTPQVMNKPPDN